MVRMMLTVVIIYALCWLPLHTVTIIGDRKPDIWEFRHIRVIWIGCHWLAMSSCCYNPFVYCWMNSTFRHGFSYVYRCFPCVHSSQHPVTKKKTLFDEKKTNFASSMTDVNKRHMRRHYGVPEHNEADDECYKELKLYSEQQEKH